MSITEAYIRHIPEFPIYNVVEFIEEWLEKEDTAIKDEVLPYLIEEKLREYEKEY